MLLLKFFGERKLGIKRSRDLKKFFSDKRNTRPGRAVGELKRVNFENKLSRDGIVMKINR